MSQRDMLVEHAKLCDSAKRYAEMVDVMDDLVTSLPNGNVALTPEERKLLAIAFKNELAPKRRAWNSLQKLTRSRDFLLAQKRMAIEYQREIATEIEELCNRLLDMVVTKLLPGVKEAESDIFYHKLKGDYYRYLMEVEEDAMRVAEYTDSIKDAYEGASDYSETDLAATHPLRIGLAMNYSVFLYEVLGETQRAREHARRFYDSAMDELETVRDVDERKYNECVGLLHLLHENIKTWEKGHGTTIPPTIEQTIPTENTMKNDF